MFACLSAAPEPRRAEFIAPPMPAHAPYSSRIPEIIAELRNALAPSPAASPTLAGLNEELEVSEGEQPQLAKGKSRVQRRR